MIQDSLDFGRLYRVKDATREMYRGLVDATDQAGVLPVAGACGIDRGDLRRALDRDGRRMAVEHAMAIGAIIADTSLIKRIGNAFLFPFGLKAVEDIPQMTDKERADRAEAACRSLGPIGEATLAAVMGRR